MSARERVEVTTVVAADPDTAFGAFTDDVDAWWAHRPNFRSSRAPRGTMRFEGGEGGRLVEIWDEATGRLHELGRILVWKPGDAARELWPLLEDAWCEVSTPRRASRAPARRSATQDG